MDLRPAGPGIDALPRDAALVTAVTIAAQLVAIAPGGVGTYEAAATAALVATGAEPGAALAAAVAAHALKTAYALAAGGVGALHPSPGLFGRVRLPRARPAPPPAAPAPPGPVALVLPAHDEGATVAGVVAWRRPPGPAARCGCIVVDDGSTDDTGGRGRGGRGAGGAAREQPRARRRGRRGLAEGSPAGPRRSRSATPTASTPRRSSRRWWRRSWTGRADYVVGSRFAGRIERMRPHRRVGNLACSRACARSPLAGA